MTSMPLQAGRSAQGLRIGRREGPSFAEVSLSSTFWGFGQSLTHQTNATASLATRHAIGRCSAEAGVDLQAISSIKRLLVEPNTSKLSRLGTNSPSTKINKENGVVASPHNDNVDNVDESSRGRDTHDSNTVPPSSLRGNRQGDSSLSVPSHRQPEQGKVRYRNRAGLNVGTRVARVNSPAQKGDASDGDSRTRQSLLRAGGPGSDEGSFRGNDKVESLPSQVKMPGAEDDRGSRRASPFSGNSSTSFSATPEACLPPGFAMQPSGRVELQRTEALGDSSQEQIPGRSNSKKEAASAAATAAAWGPGADSLGGARMVSPGNAGNPSAAPTSGDVLGGDVDSVISMEGSGLASDDEEAGVASGPGGMERGGSGPGGAEGGVTWTPSGADATDSGSSFRIQDPSSLVPGDHLVHVKLGVCRFLGVRNEVPPGRTKKVKYLLLKFQDGSAKLSAKQAKQVLYRYGLVGSPGRPPALSKLHDTAQWEKRRAKGQLAVRRMVVEMMELYVQRLRQRRPVYPKFAAEMAEFGTGFPYTPTPDQAQAFEDVERDMTERETPMDRLICGDVGFGKTEVALRAIFRALLDGRQVMVLAPTTVLAKQHFNVINDRLVRYPNVSVGLLSRFQKESEKKAVLDQIRDGSIQIIVGTHSLLGAQVVYHNLGLLVIDEEQRFGVRQKERISSLKTTVDVLTLSATPIPRTLYMSLHGFRDASRISTPPPERRPIVTHVSEFGLDVVQRAISAELQRGGQVFYVRPRVEGMEDWLEQLQLMFADVPMKMAHGQMRSSELEDVMEGFCEGAVRLLLCTSIIESGIDIREANTIIIEDAHYFGLAQVYQLRGRVGRSGEEAHAYLLHPPLEILTPEARERLEALREHGGLGQGFDLAQRDMDIRGIGDVFGERQSGDVGGVGYYLFMEMLHTTLTKIEQESLPRVEYDNVQLDIAVGFEAVPVSYVPSPRLRARLQADAEGAGRGGMQSLLLFCTRMRKEFGDETPEMEMALKVLFLRRIAADLGMHRIFVRDGSSTVVVLTAMKQPAFERLSESVTDSGLRKSLSFHSGRIELASRQRLSPADLLNRTLACLGQMRNALPSFVNYL